MKNDKDIRLIKNLNLHVKPFLLLTYSADWDIILFFDYLFII